MVELAISSCSIILVSLHSINDEIQKSEVKLTRAHKIRKKWNKIKQRKIKNKKKNKNIMDEIPLRFPVQLYEWLALFLFYFFIFCDPSILVSADPTCGPLRPTCAVTAWRSWHECSLFTVIGYVHVSAQCIQRGRVRLYTYTVT